MEATKSEIALKVTQKEQNNGKQIYRYNELKTSERERSKRKVRGRTKTGKDSDAKKIITKCNLTLVQ